MDCDFIHDRTAEGRPLNWLSLADECIEECLVLHAADRIGGADARRILGRMAGRHGAPAMICGGDGSEFVCKALADWPPSVGTEPIPAAPGSPWQNGFSASFHGRLRDEFLERHESESAADARAKASWSRREYNHVRPHSSLGHATPSEYAAACQTREGNGQVKANICVEIMV